MEETNIIGLIFAILMGMGFGSFGTAIYYREPNGETWSGKWYGGRRAHCTSCGQKLKTRHMIPLFNWLITMGECGYCGVKIDPGYFFIELSVTIFSVLLFLQYGITEQYILLLLITELIVILVAIDTKYHYFPDRILIILIFFCAIYRVMQDGSLFWMVQNFGYAVIVGLIYKKIREDYFKQEVKNYSYLKFIAVTALFLTPLQLFIFLSIAAPMAIAVNIFSKNRPAPVGIAFGVAAIFQIFYPELPEML